MPVSSVDVTLDADRRHLWHPFTQADAYAGRERVVVGAAGNYLIDDRGRRVFDALSSVWVTVHGHSHPHIVDAISRQARQLDHATLLGQTHPHAALLAQRLSALLGGNLRRAFFGSDGASAVEAALKIAVQYWHNRGQPSRSLIVSHTRGYHGDTIGALSVSGVDEFARAFAPLRFPTIELAWSDAYADDLRATLAREGERVAAVIIEPLLQAAGGVRLMPPAVLRDAAAACRERGVLLIADEIATGFGRTGTMFAFERAGIEPDIVTLGKGLAGGALALSATMTTEEIFDAFRGEHRLARHFFHGHSFAGNPVACAAAIASLDLFERERTLELVAERLPRWYADLDALRALPQVADVRRLGYFAGVDVRGGADAGDGAPTRAWALCDRLWETGFFVRPIGPALLLVPPLSSTPDELAALVAGVRAALSA